VGRFGRKSSEGGGEMPAESAPAPAGIPDRGFNQPRVTAPRTLSGKVEMNRITSYPQGAEPFAPKVWKERTTGYNQAAAWARRTYDSIN